MNTDGSNKTQLTNEATDELYGAFSPDGSMIVYNANNTGDAVIDIWRMDFYRESLAFSYYGGTPTSASPSTMPPAYHSPRTPTGPGPRPSPSAPLCLDHLFVAPSCFS